MAPAPLLLILIASASAGLAQVLWGQRWRQLLIFWLAAFAGCLISYTLGLRLPIHLPSPASIPILEVILGAWLMIIIASRLRL